MSKLKVSAIHDPDNDNEALTIDQSGNVTFSANVDMSAGTVTGIDTSNGDTAFSWGDHAQAGYLTTETYTGTLSNVVEDTSPQLGGNLDLNSSNITGTGNISITGNVTAGDVTVDNIVPSTQLSHRNLIINGAMNVSQRGTSSSGLQNSPQYVVDRFAYRREGTWSSVSFTMSKETDAPNGFTKSLKLTSSGTQTPSGTTSAYFGYYFEGQDLQHLAYGTSDAKTMTLSFWVKSSLTGKVPVTFSLEDAGKHYYTYVTVNSTNTWEYKTVTISGDTTSSIVNDNTVGVRFSIGGGSSAIAEPTLNSWISATNRIFGNSSDGYIDIAGTSGASTQITGVQLEVGSVATPFEHRSYGEELARCQRYYEEYATNYLPAHYTGYMDEFITNRVHFKIRKRTTPTISLKSGLFRWSYWQFNWVTDNITSITSDLGTKDDGTTLRLSKTGSQSPDTGSTYIGQGNTAIISIDAEL